jgi:mannose-6-phosphate isomerase-like protein (cupin superfamily)
MRRLAVSVLLVGLVGLALASTGSPGGLAQEATPAPLLSGITLTVLANGLPSGAPDQVLYLIRVVQAPGGWIAPHYHPGAQVFYVDQGTVGFTVYKGTLRLVRAGTATPGAVPGTAGELVSPGTEVLLGPGDWLYYEQDVIESARNAGEGESVILLSTLYAAGQPLTVFTNPEGTPIPATPVH